MMNFRDEAVVPLSAVLLSEGQALHYEYDFGDGWEHQIVLEKITSVEPCNEKLPRCIKAVRRCPPEDVGGLHGFYEFLEAMEDMAHPEHIDVREWFGEWFDPEFVDLDQINADLAGGASVVAPMAPYSPIRSEEHVLGVILTRGEQCYWFSKHLGSDQELLYCVHTGVNTRMCNAF